VINGALYPGTFDPVTNGHEELVRRAAELFPRVVVGVAASPSKTPLFSLDERIALIRTVFADLDNVDVEGYEGLTVDCARSLGLGAILRGLRAVSDYEYELQLANMNRHLEAGIETVFLTPTEKFSFVSSTLIREIASMGGNVSEFVHPNVEEALRKRFTR